MYFMYSHSPSHVMPTNRMSHKGIKNLTKPTDEMYNNLDWTKFMKLWNVDVHYYYINQVNMGLNYYLYTCMYQIQMYCQKRFFYVIYAIYLTSFGYFYQ